MIGQHLPPDYSRGDETTLGGYAAVHGRPPAFDGPDGVAYSVDILVDETGEPGTPWGAYLFFVRWSPGTPALAGHIESEFLTRALTADDARADLGQWPLTDVKGALDRLIHTRGAA
jgi:hypothetical protein